MAEVRHLNNAPITEAIIDFRVKLPSEFKVEAFLELKKYYWRSISYIRGA